MKIVLQALTIVVLTTSPAPVWAQVQRKPTSPQQLATTSLPSMHNQSSNTNKVGKTDAEWRRQLTPEQYRVLRQRGTERPFTGQYWRHREVGRYVCVGCGQELFVSATKFDSGCGWPSFYAPTDSTAVAAREDRSHGMIRTEVLCAKCGGHLGHVFNDGPAPTGLRYCINSVALKFEPDAGAKPTGKGNSSSPPRPPTPAPGKTD